MASTDRIAAILDRVAADLAQTAQFPEATYRLQFHAGFTFRDATRLLAYWRDLGISHLYASPYLKARPGSQHGYDISDHRVLNPEIGSEEDYAAWVQAIQEHGLGQVCDVVPNHMGIAGNENSWWNDILENGPSSPYASFFDIDWYSSLKAELREKVLLPMLGGTYGEVLEAGQLSVQYQAGVFTIHYFDHRFPVAPDTYGLILEHRLAELQQTLGPEAPALIEYQSILTAIKHLPSRSEREPARTAERLREKEVIKRRLAAVTESTPAVQQFLADNIALFNGKVGDPHSFDLLDNLLNAQAYRLAFWRVATDEINYRRFFDVNELAAVSMERPEVFTATHELIFRLLRERKVTGLRIDHPDGLYDPKQYLQRLQRHHVLERARTLEGAAADWADLQEPLLQEIQARQERGEAWLQRPLYVLVEKILGKAEPLPEDWPVHGTTGYGHLNAINGLFVDTANARAFTTLYQRWTFIPEAFPDLVYRNKFLILQVSLSSELHMLAHQLDQLSERNRWSRDFTLTSLRHALREIIACFPVYRSYITGPEIPPRDRAYVQSAVARAKRRNPAISASLFDFVRDLLLFKSPDSADDAFREEQRRFVGKFQQVTAPVMAKGVEDTAFYVYNRLLSLNEVGGDPDQFGIAPAVFHQRNQDRQAKWPRSFSATATHDTKRGEDVRARLNVLSEMPLEWRQCLNRWQRLNKRYRIQLEDQAVPDRNEEYFLYQTLVGAWPLEPATTAQMAEFGERIQAYMQKAIHEAKVHTSWINPHREYDEAIRQFVANILDDKLSRRFLDDMRSFQKQISHLGLFNSLSQTLSKIVSPGVPDTYQGTELWDFSLVDPDNRRPVDYELRQRLLGDLRGRFALGGDALVELARELAATKEDGRIKMYVVWRALHARRAHPGLFAEGEYVPLEAVGSRRDNVVALVRRREAEAAVVVVPRLITRLVAGPNEQPVGAAAWQDTAVVLPNFEPETPLRNVYTGEVLTPAAVDGRTVLPLADVLRHFPVALLMR